MATNQIPQRYAFIDVQNTATTTRKLLGFLIDWHKLCGYLKEKWKCEKVFFYSGIDEGDTETAKEFETLSSNGCIVKSKTVYSYKRPDRTIAIKCVQCGADNAEVVDMGYNRIMLAVNSIAAVAPPKVPSTGASGRLAAAPVELPDMSI